MTQSTQSHIRMKCNVCSNDFPMNDTDGKCPHCNAPYNQIYVIYYDPEKDIWQYETKPECIQKT